MPGSDGLGFLGILKKAVSWDLDLDESSCFAAGMRARWLGQWVESWRWTNSQHSKNCVSLSSCRKPKSQEGNKSFVSEPRESSLFWVFFGFLCVRIFYACEHLTFVHYGYITYWLRLCLTPYQLLEPCLRTKSYGTWKWRWYIW